MYDFILRNARIIDGTGSPWRRGDVAVKDGTIAAVGFVSGEAKEIIDATGLYLAPGFIDIHSHSDDSIFDYPLAESRILQGVTTELSGNCGSSVVYHPGQGGYPGMKSYLDAVDALHPSTNIAMLVGQGDVRASVVGYDDRPATSEEIASMRSLVARAMEEGAFGLSTGLIYFPGRYADTAELIELTKAIKPYGGFYATHMRNEGAKIVSAVEEALAIGRGADVPVEISHHKVTHRPSWHYLCKVTTAMIEKAREEGLDVTCDQYPYRASSTGLSSNAPAWSRDGGKAAFFSRLRDPETRARLAKECNQSHEGRWDTIYLSDSGCPEFAWANGKNMVEIAQALGREDIADLVFDILLASDNEASEICFGMCEEDIEWIMKKPYTMIGSDGSALSLTSPGVPHPRNYATFVRVLSEYCLKRKLFPLEEAVRKMTAAPAAKLGLADRGAIKKGLKADLVLFDAATLNDDPSFTKPQQNCSGIKRVYVNGVLTALDGKHTGARAGVALRRGQE